MKRILAILLSASMILGNSVQAVAAPENMVQTEEENIELLTAVSEEESTPVYQAYWGLPEVLAPKEPTSTSDSWTGDRIRYFGKANQRYQDSNAYNDSWKIIDPENGLLLADGIALSYYTWPELVGAGNSWSTDLTEVYSDLDTWVYESDKFDNLEKSAIREVRLLSKEEMKNTAYGFSNSDEASASRKLDGYYYQLDSGTSEDQTWVTSGGGFDTWYSSEKSSGVVPAIQLDTSKIFMTRYAGYSYGYAREDKSASADREWDILLKSGDEFEAELPETVPYQGAFEVHVTNPGSLEYDRISMVVSTLSGTDDALLVYDYSSYNGAATYRFSLPEELGQGTYRLTVFAENSEDSDKVAYVSNAVEGTITVEGAKVSKIEITEHTYGNIELQWTIENMTFGGVDCKVYRADSMDGIYTAVSDVVSCIDSSGSWTDINVGTTDSTANGIYYYKVCVGNGSPDDTEVYVTNAGMYYGTLTNEVYIGAYLVDSAGVKVNGLELKEGESKRLTVALGKNDKTEEVMTSEQEVSVYWRVSDKYYTTDDFRTNLNNDVWMDTSKVTVVPGQSDYDGTSVHIFEHEVYLLGKAAGEYYLTAYVLHDGGRWYWQIPVTIETADEDDSLIKEYEEGVGNVFTDQDAMNQKIRTDMVERKADAVYVIPESATNEMNIFAFDYPEIIFDFEQEREGMKPYEGDYIRWQHASPTEVAASSGEWTIGQTVFNGDNWNYILSEDQQYMTTVAQEEKINEKMESLMWTSGGALYEYKDASRYEQVKAALQYVKNHVAYKGTSTPIYHTCYSALIDKVGTCQAYALLFGRILREWNIPNKIIMNNSSGAHTYNIVEMEDGAWYYCDATSGALLKGDSSFLQGEYQDLFKTEAFTKNYLDKISDTDYVPPFVCLYRGDERVGAYGSILAAVEKMKDDHVEPGNETCVYTLDILDDAFLSDNEWNIEDISYVADLNGHILTVSDDAIITATQIQNGTIKINKDVRLTLKGNTISKLTMTGEGVWHAQSDDKWNISGDVRIGNLKVESDLNGTPVIFHLTENSALTFAGSLQREGEGTWPIIKITKETPIEKGEILASVIVSEEKVPVSLFVIENENGLFVVRENDQLKAAGVAVKIRLRGDEQDAIEKEFAKWSDAAAYLKTIKDASKDCEIELLEDVDIGKTLTLPLKIRSITIKGNENKPKLICSGTLKVNGNVTFEDVKASFSSVSSGSKGTLTLDHTELSTTKTVSFSGSLTMTSSMLTAPKITINNLITQDAYNVLSYGGGKNLLTIKGMVSSDDESDEEVIVSRDGIVKNVIARKNAVTLNADAMENTGYEQGVLLVDAVKAGAGWFVIGSAEDSQDGRTIAYGTYKSNGKIYCGELDGNVNLYSSTTGTDGTYEYESSFVTLQDALTEIDKLAVSNRYYKAELVKTTKEEVTFTKKDLKFPSKAAGLLIISNDEDARLYYKGSLSLKCDTVLKSMTLVPTGKASFTLGNYELVLSNCQMADDAVLSKITGSGVKKDSVLLLDNTSLEVNGDVNNIGELVFAGTTSERISLIADGKVNIGDIMLATEACLAGSAAVTRKKGSITKVKTNITLNGQVFSKSGDETLYLDLREKNSQKQYVSLALDGDDSETVVKSGVAFVKALNVTYSKIYSLQTEQCLIKSAGHFTYFSDGLAGVELSYTDADEKEIAVLCRNFGDAVTEINNWKEKRAYTIVLNEAIAELSGAGNDVSVVPQKLTMPKKNYISALKISSDEMDPVSMGFLGTLTLTCDTTLENVKFVQLVKTKDKVDPYKPAEEVNSNPKMMTLNAAGYQLVPAEKEVLEKFFNVPLLLKGIK